MPEASSGTIWGEGILSGPPITSGVFGAGRTASARSGPEVGRRFDLVGGMAVGSEEQTVSSPV